MIIMLEFFRDEISHMFTGDAVMDCFKSLFLSVMSAFLFCLSAGAEESTVVYKLIFDPKIALTVNFTKEDSSKEKNLEGEVGISIIGNTNNKSFFTGFSCGFLLENFKRKQLYGINTGICGNWKNVYGAELSFGNRNEIVAGLQSGLLGNLADTVYGVQLAALYNSLSEGAGLQIAFGNEQLESETKDEKKKASHDFIQAGVINYAENGILFQIGLLNISRERGLQLGLINYSRNNFLPFFPIFNF